MLILILLIMLFAPMAAFSSNSDNTSDDIAMLLSLALIDYQQSVNIFNRDGSYELNPILGKAPNRVDMLAFGFIGVGATYLVADMLPEPWKQILLDSVIASEKMNIQENERIYSGWNAEGPPLGGRINFIPIVLSFRF